MVVNNALDGSTTGEGTVVSVLGACVTLELAANRHRTTVGSFVAIRLHDRNLVCIVTEVRAAMSDERVRVLAATVHLVGEILGHAGGVKTFRRGVSIYPTVGDAVAALSRDDIKLVHGGAGDQQVELGALYHDPNLVASVDAKSLLSRHFSILGSTGVGKSSAVAVILREILAHRSDVRIFMLDTHNEYGACFGDIANVISPRSTKLPFWLFNFDEFVDVLYAGRPGVDEELEILTELIPLAKSQYLAYKSSNDRMSLKRPDARHAGYTVDTPVPYLLQDLLSLIDDRMGKLENRSSRLNYHRLMARIDVIRSDPRYDFMFENANVGGDTMAELLNQFFRIQTDGRPITIMQLAALPMEVMDAVVSVLCRLAFDFGQWSDGAVPLLFVCEEAHRYASNDHSIGFGPTRRALSRIAKEGRKYRVSLGLVSQRPAELDPTILSQCATLFAMRLASERDHALLQSALSDDTANLLTFLPTLGVREAIAFGEAVPIPTRMTFRALPEHLLPKNESSAPASDQGLGLDFVQGIVDRWRRSHTDRKNRVDEMSPSSVQPQAASSSPAVHAMQQQASAFGSPGGGGAPSHQAPPAFAAHSARSASPPRSYESPAAPVGQMSASARLENLRNQLARR